MIAPILITKKLPSVKAFLVTVLILFKVIVEVRSMHLF